MKDWINDCFYLFHRFISTTGFAVYSLTDSYETLGVVADDLADCYLSELKAQRLVAIMEKQLDYICEFKADNYERLDK